MAPHTPRSCITASHWGSQLVGRRRPTMRCAPHELGVSGTWADALFASALQRSEEPSPGQIRQAVAAAMNTFGDLGCAARLAQAHGEAPETPVTPMPRAV